MARNNNRKGRVKGKVSKNNYKDRDRLTDSGAEGKFDRESADTRDRRDCFRSQHNDPAWYSQNPQLVKDYASMMFGFPTGTLLPKSLGFATRAAIPGIMSLEFCPAIGQAQVENDPINIAARNIYSFVRHANSGHSNYEAPDLMLYLIAMDSVYMMHSFMKRALGVVLDYSPVNRYYPSALLKAMYIDPDDLAAHTADFRGFINQYAVKMGSMCVPNSMSYMARHTWMCEGLYTDDPMSAKAQTYMYTPTSFYLYEEGSGSTLSKISLVSISQYFESSGYMSVSKLMQLANDLLNPILASEDMNIMSGDILKAFGSEGIVKVTGVLDGYMVLPVYSQEVLSQIENATVLGGAVAQHIEQQKDINTGYLTCTYGALVQVGGDYVGGSAEVTVLPQAWNSVINERLLNFHHDGVSPDEVMVATRLAFTYGNQVAAGTSNRQVAVTLGAVGSEIVTRGYIYQYTGGLATNPVSLSLRKISFQTLEIMVDVDAVTSPGTTLGGMVTELSLLSAFDWHPAVYCYYYAEEDSIVNAKDCGLPCMDIANFAVVSPTNLENLHLTAMLSEFSVPQMGAFSKSV